METAIKLKVLSEKSLHQAANPNFIEYCLSMDLLALVTTDQQVQIYRLNGQRVYASTQKKNDLKVDSISWKPNGQLFASAWSDGSVRLVGAESTKVVHQFKPGDGSSITCIGWASNLTRKVVGPTTSNKKHESWSDLLSDENVEFETKTILNLPRDLSQIDIETSLPKLSVLASGGTSEDVFSSRASLDAIFRPFDPKDTDAVDIMVVGTQEGNLHLSIYDSFVVGSFKSPVVLGSSPSLLIRHASHEQYSTHSLLLKSSDEEGRLFLVPMDLRFVSASSDYLSFLASRSSALQNLLRYIHEVQKSMAIEWKSTQELPGKFLRNINETLTEKYNKDIVQALYHSVATGHTFPVVKEWLVDELTERGHKRWDKAVTLGLQNLKLLIHENMLPALDRCSVILSRFAGIAKFQGSKETVGFSSQQISMITDTIACLYLVSTKILIRVVDELELFSSFSIWLRYEIDRLASDASSTPEDDATEKESMINHGKVLLYIQSAMTTSPLAAYFGNSSPEDFAQSWKSSEQGVSMFDFLDQQIQKQEQGQPYLTSLTHLEQLCSYLTKQASAVFGQIAEAEKRNVLFGDPLDIGFVKQGGAMDMKVIELEPSVCQTYVAFAPKDKQSLIRIVRATIAIERGISGIRISESSAVQLGDGEVKDVKMFGESLLVLWSVKGTTNLLSIPYRSSKSADQPSGGNFQMEYLPYAPKSADRIITFTNEQVLRQIKKYQIPGGQTTFVPEKIQTSENNLKKGKDFMGTIILLGQNSMHYKIFKLSEENSGDEVETDVAMDES